MNWENDRKQRNLVTKMCKRSMSKYLENKCETKDGNMIWNVVRPLIPDKAKYGQETIVLNDIDHILIAL